MARRKKGRAVNGWIIVDKPAGFTSTAVVNKVKWAFNAQKAGHAGTLDPDATGVLAIALGEATKTVPYITDAMKCYRFEVRLGQSTNTDDADGEIIAQSDARPADEDILAELKYLTGDIMQIPPKFSAVKIDGQRAYKLARKDEEFEIEARPLYVEDLHLIERRDEDHIILEMTCGKGGYVRSIARDLGEALGCFAHVSWLRREWSGPWAAADGISIEKIESLAKSEEIDQLLLPVEDGLADLDEMMCTPEGAQKLHNGNPGMVYPADGIEYGDEAWASFEGKPIAVGRYKSGALHPTRVFNL